MKVACLALLAIGCHRPEAGEESPAVPASSASVKPASSAPPPRRFSVDPDRPTRSQRYRCLILHETDACCALADPLGGSVPWACCRDPVSADCQYPDKKRRPL